MLTKLKSIEIVRLDDYDLTRCNNYKSQDNFQFTYVINPAKQLMFFFFNYSRCVCRNINDKPSKLSRKQLHDILIMYKAFHKLILEYTQSNYVIFD